MTLYEHLSVLISIVIGLGLTEVLSNVHGLVQARERVRVHWLPVTWTVLVFVGIIQWWWSSFTFQARQEWNFFYFLFLMVRPVATYLSAAFVLPRVQAGKACDLRAYYFDVRGWLFPLLASGNVIDGIRRWIEGEALGQISVWSNFVSAAVVGSLALSESERYHAVVTVITIALFGVFLVQAALTLG